MAAKPDALACRVDSVRSRARRCGIVGRAGARRDKMGARSFCGTDADGGAFELVELAFEGAAADD